MLVWYFHDFSNSSLQLYGSIWKIICRTAPQAYFESVKFFKKYELYLKCNLNWFSKYAYKKELKLKL